jgi:hypothetical protein
MPKAYETWTPHPHGPLEKLDADLWRVEGSLPGGMPLRRVLTIIRLEDGRLVLHNPVALEEAAMKEIEALGEPAFLVVPSGFHRLDAKVFGARYPNAKVLAPRGGRAKVEEVVGVHGTIDELPRTGRVEMDHVEGTREQEGVLTVRSDSGTTLVFNDIVFNMPHLPGFKGFILRHVTKSSGGPTISRIARFALVKDKRALRDHLGRLADTPDLVRIVMSHHVPITEKPAEALRGLARSI